LRRETLETYLFFLEDFLSGTDSGRILLIKAQYWLYPTAKIVHYLARTELFLGEHLQVAQNRDQG